MLLTLDGQPRDLIPIRDFRTAHDLLPDFGVAWFEQKDYTGLGRIDRAGAELNGVRAALLDALPSTLPATGWLAFLPGYARLFEDRLYAINEQVGLKAAEIEFAVAGLSDVLHHVAYALIRGVTPPPQGEGIKVEIWFRRVYAEWLDNSVKVFSQVYPYQHRGQSWGVQIFAHAYGRAGLVVRAGDETHYLYDPALGCPAEGFMAMLVADISAQMLAATQP